jgi:hypothetical protein
LSQIGRKTGPPYGVAVLVRVLTGTPCPRARIRKSGDALRVQVCDLDTYLVEVRETGHKFQVRYHKATHDPHRVNGNARPAHCDD